jgi:hypothetical protein
MGWKSTITITREDALFIAKKALEAPELKDEELANALESLVGDRVGYNYTIIERYVGDSSELNGGMKAVMTTEGRG